MKKIIAIIAVAMTMFTATANAQLKFGVKGGLNLTSVSTSGNIADNLKKENQAGFFFGPTIKASIPIVGLGVDASALYNQTQSKMDGVDVKQQSIAIPLNVRYSLPVVPVYVFAGPQFDFNVGDKGISLNSVPDYKLKDSNISVNIGAGVLLSHLQLSINYNIPCGNTGEFDSGKLAEAVIGDQKATFKSWQLGLAYYF